METGKNEIPAWVFASSEGTSIDVHNVAKREFPKCLAKAGLRRIRFHDLRYALSFFMFLVFLPPFASVF
jgi:integrase